MMIVIAFDPGGTVGYAFYDGKELTIHGGEITDDNDYHLKLWSMLGTMQPNTIIYEQFTYRKGKEAADLTARDCIGVIKLYAGLHKQSVALLDSPVVKGKSKTSFWSDDKLKRIGLYNVGKPHQNDATRHLLHYLVDVLNINWPVELLVTH